MGNKTKKTKLTYMIYGERKGNKEKKNRYAKLNRGRLRFIYIKN